MAEVATATEGEAKVTGVAAMARAVTEVAGRVMAAVATVTAMEAAMVVAATKRAHMSAL